MEDMEGKNFLEESNKSSNKQVSYEKCKILKNILLISLGFLLNFISFVVSKITSPFYFVRQILTIFLKPSVMVIVL